MHKFQGTAPARNPRIVERISAFCLSGKITSPHATPYLQGRILPLLTLAASLLLLAPPLNAHAEPISRPQLANGSGFSATSSSPTAQIKINPPATTPLRSPRSSSPTSSARPSASTTSAAAGTAMNLFPVLKPNDPLASALSSDTVMQMINPKDTIKLEDLKDKLQATPDPIFRTANLLYAIEMFSKLSKAEETIDRRQ